MAKSNNTLCLDKFYPERDLMITDIAQQSDKIIIRMKSTSSSCKCPKCNHITQKYHGTYTRKVQDLPILGKQVQLEICSHEYACLNDECEAVSIAETFDGFLNNYSHYLERCMSLSVHWPFEERPVLNIWAMPPKGRSNQRYMQLVLNKPYCIFLYDYQFQNLICYFSVFYTLCIPIHTGILC